MNDILTAAQQLHTAGIRVIPIASDGSKRPTLRSWPTHATTTADLEHWFTGDNPHQALGVVCGDPSGGLEMLEVEAGHDDAVTELRDIAEASGLADLWYRVMTGWMEQSPSGGYHWFTRLAEGEVPGNTKLAKTADKKVIAETRGTGGQTVLAPSAGAAHPTGRPWVRLQGGLDTIPVLTADERESLHSLFRTLDQTPTITTAQETTTPAPRDPNEGTTPPDDFEAQTSWAQILEPYGWTVALTRGEETFWTRPGKTFGISATTGYSSDRDRLYVFTTSTEFDSEVPYTKFGAWALLHHDGDHSAAAAALRKAGYGDPARTTNLQDAPATLEQRGLTSAPQPTGTDGGTVIDLDAHRNTRTSTDDQPDLKIMDSYGLSLTDDSNAQAFVEEYGDRVRYQSDRGRWLHWNGHAWEPQPSHAGIVKELAKDVARRLPERNDADEPKKVLAWKRSSLSERGLNAMLSMSRTDPQITVTADDLDAHPWELNTPNGIINLRTGERHPNNPARLHTRTTTVTPDMEANPTVWNGFLTTAIPDEQVRTYLQRLAGYTLVGEVREHVLPFIHGPGGNGKGVFLEAIRGVLGDYAGKAPAGFLVARQQQDHPSAIASLAGKRMALAAEVNERDRFDEQRIKELTGGDTLSARYLYGDFFDFTPSHTLWLMANDKPAIDSGGKAFTRRLRLIPFTTEIPEDERDETLQDRLLRDHGPAVLAWMVQGAIDYATHGLGPAPASVVEATEDYAADFDTVGMFLDEECYTGDSYSEQTTRVSTLRSRYEAWCQANGVSSLGRQRFSKHLQRHGLAPIKSTGGTRVYEGVMLKPEQNTLDHWSNR